MSKTFDVAVVGAAGAVGEALLTILEERGFPVGTLYPLAGPRQAGSRVEFRGSYLMVQDVGRYDFSRARLAFFVTGTAVAAEYAPKAAAAGCVVIDRSPQFRREADVPVVVPEANPGALAGYGSRHIVASPCCASIALAVALKPIHDRAGITRINVATYQAVSGAGKDGVEELASQSAALLNLQPIKTKTFPAQIAFNVLPQVGDFLDNGYTGEEMKIVWEMRKLFGDDALQVNPTAVRVPVFFGHAAAVHIETREKMTAAQARALLAQAPGVEVVDERAAGGYPTPVAEAGRDAVCVGRIREDISHPLGLDLWVVTDNVRKGAALNSVQIAEILVKDYLS